MMTSRCAIGIAVLVELELGAYWSGADEGREVIPGAA